MMKVLLLNGSPHRQGCTHAALEEVASTLQQQGIDTEILWLGSRVQGGCQGCGACRKSGFCVTDDAVNEVLEKLPGIDGLVLGAPVHYASPAGDMVAALDRIFFAGGALLRGMPGAAVVSARRAGTTAALEVLQKYINYSNMPLVGSQYWPMVHGATAGDARRDLEGMQIMRQLGRNMAWLLQCIAAGRAAGVPEPQAEPPVKTNFIQPPA